MRSFARRSAISLLIAGFVAATSLSAATLVRMNLGDLCDRADKIFRGEVIEANPGSVKAGGGDLPTMTYKVVVDDTFKGSFTEVKGIRFAEIRMLGKVEPVRHGDMVRFNLVKDLPTIEVGQTYLFFTTAPGSTGLSTTVGLGQGNFRISGKGEKMTAVNEFGNVGLFAGMEAAGAPARGPISYSDLADRIRAELGRE